MGHVLHPLGFDTRTLADVPEARAHFLASLNQHGVRVHPASELAQCLVDLDHYLAFQLRSRAFANATELARVLRNGHSAMRLVHLLFGLDAGNFAQLVPHLRVFSGRDVAFMRAGRNSKDRNTAWEIMCFAALARVSTGVRLDEPDVLCAFGDTLWGLACKVSYVPEVDAVMNAIVKGAKQIEGSAADLGIVAVNATNLIDHERFIECEQLGQHRNWPHPKAVGDVLKGDLRALIGALDMRGLADRLRTDRLGRPRRKIRGVLFVASTVAWAGGAPCDVDQSLIYQFRKVRGPELDFMPAIARELAA